MREDLDGRLATLFFSYLYSIEMLKEHPNVVLLDCTYKINKFNMPFLYIVSVNSIEKTFNITFSFLLNKLEKIYKFAIKSLCNLFTKVDRTPRYFITDNNTALKNVLKRYFLDVL